MLRPVTSAAQPIDPLALESQLCFALARASRGVVNAYRAVLEPLGLTHPQYLVMLALWQHGPLSLTRLADLVALEPATLSPLVRRVESIGYVTRRRDPGDERTLVIALTEEGRRLRRRAEQVPLTMADRLRLDLDALPAQLTALNALADAADAASGREASGIRRSPQPTGRRHLR